MYDSIDVRQIPANAAYAAGYTSGHWPTYANGSLKAHLPHARLLSIAVTAAHDAECLDIETGDAVNWQAPGWIRRQHARGVKRPVLYTSASNVGALINVCSMNGLNRWKDYVIWAAHYTRRHKCSPAACGYPAADGTQWTSRALGRTLDQSLLEDAFFAYIGDGTPTSPPKPPVNNANATVKQGDHGATVMAVQLRLIAWHVYPAGKADGSFGPATAIAVRAFQAMTGLSQDGVVGPSTRAALNKNPATFTYPAPLGLKAGGGRTSSFTCSWSAPLHYGQPVPQYMVYVYDVTGGKPASRANLVASYPRMVKAGVTRKFSGGSLKKGHSYVVHVVACGPNGSKARPGVYASAPFKVG
jgi:peptidoglycan hydrolase-like protein with peptidoglycan-binding domain